MYLECCTEQGRQLLCFLCVLGGLQEGLGAVELNAV